VENNVPEQNSSWSAGCAPFHLFENMMSPTALVSATNARAFGGEV
jgi:hypothetical protein